MDQTIISTSTIYPRGKDSPPCGVSIIKFVNAMEKLTSQQKLWVIEMGFESLLKIEMITLDKAFLTWLYDRVNVKTRSLQMRYDKLVKISGKDVGCIMGIPTSFRTKVVKKLMPSYRVRYYEGNIGIRREKVANLMSEEQHDKILFKEHFLLFVMGTLLCPTVDLKNISPKLLAILVNADQANELDWGTFILDKLLEAVKNYKALKQKHPNKVIPLGACPIILMLFYLDRLDMPPVDWDVKKARITVWTNGNVKEAIKMDQMSRYAYGRLKVINVEYGYAHPNVLTWEHETNNVRWKDDQELLKDAEQYPDSRNGDSEAMSSGEGNWASSCNPPPRPKGETYHGDNLIPEFGSRKRAWELHTFCAMSGSLQAYPQTKQMSKEEIKLADDIMCHRDNNSVVFISCIGHLTVREMKSNFRPKGQVSTQVMNFYCWNLTQRSTEDKKLVRSYYMSPFLGIFYIMKADLKGHQQMQDSAKEAWEVFHKTVDAGPSSKCRNVFVPILYKDHWTAYCFCFPEKRIYVFDSVFERSNEFHKEIQSKLIPFMNTYLEEVHKTQPTASGTSLGIGSWDIKDMELPKQEDKCSCGIYILEAISGFNDGSIPHMPAKDELEQCRKNLLVNLVTSRFNQVRPDSLVDFNFKKWIEHNKVVIKSIAQTKKRRGALCSGLR